jgi:hypothetical protein
LSTAALADEIEKSERRVAGLATELERADIEAEVRGCTAVDQLRPMREKRERERERERERDRESSLKAPGFGFIQPLERIT